METRISIPQLHSSEPAPVAVAVKNAVDTFARAYAASLNVPSAIHSRDPIFGRARAGQSHSDKIQAYFDDGRRSALQLRELLSKSAIQRHLEKQRPQVLEFAPGYGWVSRHLPNVFPECELIAASSESEAVEFLKTQLGLAAHLASSKPDELQLGRQFDVIFAMSFFTQLDEGAWGGWLKSLFSQLVAGGALVFSTHGVVSRAHLGNPTLNEKGFWFGPVGGQSPSGNAIVTPGYVLRQIYEHASGSLSHFQEGTWRDDEDVYVLVK
jgi:hypothetical protein